LQKVPFVVLSQLGDVLRNVLKPKATRRHIRRALDNANGINGHAQPDNNIY